MPSVHKSKSKFMDEPIKCSQVSVGQKSKHNKWLIKCCHVSTSQKSEICKKDQLNGVTCQNDTVIYLSNLANQIRPLGKINISFI